MYRQAVRSCDTFVALPPFTRGDFVIFGKNSDRPSAEVQEVVYAPSRQHARGEQLACTYIEIEQAERTNAVVLSKPAWMWGAEMGANEHGLVVGNEAVWTKLKSAAVEPERLLGMDLLRLGLERAETAEQCVHVIGGLLEKYGQGGPCSEDMSMSYHNSFLIADRLGAWIMETADRAWVASKVQGFANISNNLTIDQNYTVKSANLEQTAIANGLWKQTDGQLSFRKAFSSNGDCYDERQINGQKLLESHCQDKLFDAQRMMSILRNLESGICMPLGGSFVSTGSQVSILPADPSVECVHFFTATPDPLCSGFKPFLFNDGRVVASPLVISPTHSPDPAKEQPRFKRKVDRRHALYKAHEAIMDNAQRRKRALENLRALEQDALVEIMASLTNKQRIGDAENLFNEAVEAEMKIFENS